MKFKIYKILIFLFKVITFGYFGFLFLVNPVLATTEVDIDHFTGLTYGGINAYRAGWSFIPTADNITGLALYGNAVSSPPIRLYLCAGDLNFTKYSAQENTGCGSDTQIFYLPTLTCTVYGLSTCMFPAQYSLTPGNHYYFIKVDGDNSMGATNGKVYSTTDYKVYGDNGSGPFDITSSSDFLFKTFFNGALQYAVNLIIPWPTPPYSNFATMPKDYVFSYSNPLNWYPQIRFMVKRQEDQKAHAWPDYVNSSTFITQSNASTTLTVASSTFQLPDGTYDLVAYFWGNTPTSPVVASTTFIVNTGGTYGGYSFSTTTAGRLFNPLSEADMSAEALCGEATTTIGCYLKVAMVSVIQWAFVPSFDTLQNFKISYELFKGSFPFNAYFGITDAILNSASSTASSTAGTIKIPFIHASGIIYMLDVVSSTTLTGLIGQTNNDLFRTTIGYIFWILAGAMIFFTIKYI